MIITIGILLAGFLLGLLLKGRVKLPTSAITLASICLLLFILGFAALATGTLEFIDKDKR